MKYSFRDRFGNFVLCWDHARFVNHSFTPSLIVTPFDLELASRDIAPGQEITDDYGWLNCEVPFVPRPEGDAYRSEVLPDDFLRHADEWDRRALDAFASFDRVPQPLFPLVRPEFHQAIRRAVEEHILEPSVAFDHFTGHAGMSLV